MYMKVEGTKVLTNDLWQHDRQLSDGFRRHGDDDIRWPQAITRAQKYCCLAGERYLVVPIDHEAAFRTPVKQIGYVLRQ